MPKRGKSATLEEFELFCESKGLNGLRNGRKFQVGILQTAMKRPEGVDKAQSDKAIFEYYSHFDPSCSALERWLCLCKQQFGSFGPAKRVIEETTNAIQDYYKCFNTFVSPLPP